MVAFTEKEMIGITELGRTLGSVIDSVAKNTVEKIAIFKSNKPQVVIIPFGEYQRMKELTDSIEHHSIADIIDERMPDGKTSEAISMEEYHQRRMERRVNAS